jgi:uncharacterized protein
MFLRWSRRLIVFFGALYLAYGVAMTLLHPALIYPFSQTSRPIVGFDQMMLTDQNGSPMVLRFSKGSPDKPAILFFMGNVGAISLFEPMLQLHRQSNRTVAALEYPGGGGNSGKPSEILLKAQALAAYDWLEAQIDVPIVVHGYSLGSGLAVHVAARRPVMAVVLEAPFAKLCHLMHDASLLPACQMPIQRWDSLADAGAVKAPVLILHGELDDLIPSTEGRALAAGLTATKVDFVPLPKGTHVNLTQQPGYADFVNRFIDGL